MAIGLGGSLAAGRLIRTMLFEVEPTDLVTLAGISLLVGASALLTTYVHARRAARIGPTTALAGE